ncbi:hypothetical protein BH10ACI2_BH10ACI2_18240 [soil metagenome]
MRWDSGTVGTQPRSQMHTRFTNLPRKVEKCWDTWDSYELSFDFMTLLTNLSRFFSAKNV